MTPTTNSNPDNDPAKQAIVLIQKLTVVLGVLKQQAESNTHAATKLEKLNQELNGKVDALNAAISTATTQPTSATKADVDALAARMADCFDSVHARSYAILAVGVISLIVAAVVAFRGIS